MRVAARIAALALGVACVFSGATRADQAAIDRGKYIFDAAGCFACHTDTKGGRQALSGGPALRTPFGTFYAPNITPDPRHGIGRWSDQDFIRALREGVSPDGRHYYPVFPYTSYTKASERDDSTEVPVGAGFSGRIFRRFVLSVQRDNSQCWLRPKRGRFWAQFMR